MQLSMGDPVYKGFLAFCTNPGKTMSGWGKSLKEFVAHPPSLAQMAAPSFSVKFFEGNNDTHPQVDRKHIKRVANPPAQTNQQILAKIESSMSDAPSAVPSSKSNSVREHMAMSSINQAPAEAPAVKTNSTQEAIAQSSIIMAPNTVPSVKANSTQESIAQSSTPNIVPSLAPKLAKAFAARASFGTVPPEEPSFEGVFAQELLTNEDFAQTSIDTESKMTFVLEPQLNKSAPWRRIYCSGHFAQGHSSSRRRNFEPHIRRFHRKTSSYK